MKTLLKKIALLSLILITINACEDCCQDGVVPNGTITEAQATELHNNYLALLAEFIDVELGTEQSRQTNFDSTELIAYMCMVKEQAADLGYSGTLGLSVYYGIEIDPNTNAKTLKVFLSPTNKNGDEICNIIGIERLNFGSVLMPPNYSVICEPTESKN